MDDLFEKVDSLTGGGTRLDVRDKEEKDSFESHEPKSKDLGLTSMDAGHGIKIESNGPSWKFSLDPTTADSGDPTEAHDQRIDHPIDIVKHEIETHDAAEDIESANRDIFGNGIALPRATHTNFKERQQECKEKSKRELEEEEREKMQVLVSNFTEDQLDRYEMYRRAAFPKAAIKRIMQTITGCSVSQNVVIAMSGIAKVFVGEIVEEALDVMDDHEDTGPLQPKHLREAVRRLRLQGQIPNGRAHKAFFRL